jgi:hypothetical protein
MSTVFSFLGLINRINSTGGLSLHLDFPLLFKHKTSIVHTMKTVALNQILAFFRPYFGLK